MIIHPLESIRVEQFGKDKNYWRYILKFCNGEVLLQFFDPEPHGITDEFHSTYQCAMDLSAMLYFVIISYSLG